MTLGFSDGTRYDSVVGLHLGQEQDKTYHKELSGDDYDYEGAKAAGVKPDPKTGHMPDTFKNPNHMTFSDESIHNDGGAGHWQQIDNKWSFTPGPTNLKHHSIDELRDYFKKNEPDSTLIEPKNDYPIDRNYHVPLAASAIMDGKGSMAGIAIDHRIPPHPEFDKFVALHEAAELPHMRNLIDSGQSPADAYHEAHDKIATPIETAAVRAHAARSGKDPDQYLEEYKQHWRDGASIAKEPTDRERHPDAHTTRYALDEHELGHPIRPLQIDVMGAGVGIHSGPGRFTGEGRADAKTEGYAKSVRDLDQSISRMTLSGVKSNLRNPPANVNKSSQDLREYVSNKTVSKWQKLEEDFKSLPEDQQKYLKALSKQQGFPLSLSDSLAMYQRSKIKLVDPSIEEEVERLLKLLKKDKE